MGVTRASVRRRSVLASAALLPVLLFCHAALGRGQQAPGTRAHTGPPPLVKNCGKDDIKCWESLAKEQAARASAAWANDGTCGKEGGPGCASEQQQQQQQGARPQGGARSAPPPPGKGGGAATSDGAANGAPADSMQDAAKRAAQHAKELHDKEFERVRAESAGTNGAGGEQKEVLEELDRRAKVVGQGATKPYEVLGVPVSATRSEIKKAYRHLSLMLHPDKIKDPKLKETANGVFMDIVAAYEVLGNEDKRQAFDDLGDADGAKKETFNTYWEYQKFGNKKTKENNDFFTGHPLIVNLHSSYWDRRVTGSSVWLVDFYAPWCGHCVTMVPDFKQIATKLESHETLQVGAVNCEKDKKFCQEVGVTGYPTLALFSSSDTGLVEFYPRGQAKTPPLVEKWARQKAEEWRWLLEAGPPAHLTQATYEQQVQRVEDPWIVIFLQNKKSREGKEAMMHVLSLAAEVRGLVRVGVVDCASEARLCYSQHKLKRNSKGELRYYRAGTKACPGVKYDGDHIVDLADVEVRDALMMTARLVRVLGAAASDPCGQLAAEGGGGASWEKSQAPDEQQQQRASWNRQQPQRQVFRGPMVGGGGGRRAGIGR